MHPLLEDPWVAAQIDAAIAPYRSAWPASAETDVSVKGPSIPASSGTSPR